MYRWHKFLLGADKHDKINQIFKGGFRNMKTVKLCQEGSCCPKVTLTDTKVEIGEKGNTCVLTLEQWKILKEKVLSKEL